MLYSWTADWHLPTDRATSVSFLLTDTEGNASTGSVRWHITDGTVEVSGTPALVDGVFTISFTKAQAASLGALCNIGLMHHLDDGSMVEVFRGHAHMGGSTYLFDFKPGNGGVKYIVEMVEEAVETTPMAVYACNARPAASAVPVGTVAVMNVDVLGAAITSITKATTAVVTAPGHGFANSDKVWIKGVAGMTDVNDKEFTVANKQTDTFELSGVNSTSYGAFSLTTTNVTAVAIDEDTGVVTVTAAAHGLADGDRVTFASIGGTTQLNGKVFTVADKTDNTFVLSGIDGSAYTTYTTGGTVAKLTGEAIKDGWSADYIAHSDGSTWRRVKNAADT